MPYITLESAGKLADASLLETLIERVGTRLGEIVLSAADSGDRSAVSERLNEIESEDISDDEKLARGMELLSSKFGGVIENVMSESMDVVMIEAAREVGLEVAPDDSVDEEAAEGLLYVRSLASLLTTAIAATENAQELFGDTTFTGAVKSDIFSYLWESL